MIPLRAVICSNSGAITARDNGLNFLPVLTKDFPVLLSCMIHEKFITKMDLVNSAAFYSKNVFIVLTVQLRSFFFVCLA